MGFQAEFNWILKIQDIDISLMELDRPYNFSKKGVRIFPINIPIELVNENWEALGQCVIERVSVDEKETYGEYRLIKIYDKPEKHS